MTNTTVTVIVPTKNNSATLNDCLESIKKQTYPNIELVVVDNFSTDDTPQIARRFTSQFFSKGPERSAQRNYGVSKAKGTYVAIIDSDMTLSSRVVEHCVQEMENNTTLVGIVIPEESYGEGFWARCKKLERSYYVGVDYMEAARFFRKAVYQEVGGYDEAMVSGEDWDLSQRIEAKGRLGRVDDYIYHNEGKISLVRTIRKKFYYAQKFASYQAKNKTNNKVAKQTGILDRYVLFFSHPKKLFRNPFVGLGMLFMKTCEFGFGALGYLKAKIQQS